MKKDQNQLTWLMVSLIAFNMVWGLGRKCHADYVFPLCPLSSRGTFYQT